MASDEGQGASVASRKEGLEEAGEGKGPPSGLRPREAIPPPSGSDAARESSASLARRIVWAALLKRVFEVDALRCPDCGVRMRLIAAITDPDVARRILECLSLSSRAPPPAPQTDLEFEPATGRGTTELPRADGDEDPGFDFDQSRSDDTSGGDPF